jgi:polysaccharide export outer membrane protein
MKRVIFISFIAILISACSTKRYVYVAEDHNTSHDSTFYRSIKQQYQVQPGDVIYISIHSSLSDTKGMFHFPGQEQLTNQGNAEGGLMYLNQFVISDSGYIRMPVIGSLFIAGSTIAEIEKMVETEARRYVSDAIARVKLVSYQVTFLGEFNKVGTINFYKDRINILDAIAEAGEVTYYGDRQNIRIMRQTPDGMYTFHVDLTDKSLLSDKSFYLQPNDIIYAEPLPRKILRVNAGDYALILTTISSTLALVAVILSLK